MKDKLNIFYNYLLAKSNAIDELLQNYKIRLWEMKSVKCDQEFKEISDMSKELNEIITLFCNIFSKELD